MCLVLQDAGGNLPPCAAVDASMAAMFLDGPVFNTGAAECMRQHLTDAVDFLADVHTLGKVKVRV